MAKSTTYIDFRRCGTCTHYTGDPKYGECFESPNSVAFVSASHCCREWTDRLNPRGTEVKVARILAKSPE